MVAVERRLGLLDRHRSTVQNDGVTGHTALRKCETLMELNQGFAGLANVGRGVEQWMRYKTVW
jgi:hypothetical protein